MSIWEKIIKTVLDFLPLWLLLGVLALIIYNFL